MWQSLWNKADIEDTREEAVCMLKSVADDAVKRQLK